MGIPKTAINVLAVAIVALALMPALWVLASNRDIPQFGTYQDDGLFLFVGDDLRHSCCLLEFQLYASSNQR